MYSCAGIGVARAFLQLSGCSKSLFFLLAVYKSFACYLFSLLYLKQEGPTQGLPSMSISDCCFFCGIYEDVKFDELN